MAAVRNPPGFFPSDAFDFRQMQAQLEFPDKVVPWWFGHSLSLPPDSGVGLGSTERTGEKGAAHHKQSTLWPTIPHPAQRKRRAGSRMTTDFDLEADLALEGTQRGTPRKRALFGLGYCGSESPIDDGRRPRPGCRLVSISRSGFTLPEWGLLIRLRAYRENWRICVRIPCSITPGRHRPHISARARPYLRRLKCIGLRVRPAGNNTDRCSMPL